MKKTEMQIQRKQIEQIRITGVKNIDPITIYIDEWKDKKTDETRFQGRITILCYGIALNYYWNAMGEPLREFFIAADTGYIADKFELNARETFKPQAYEAEFDDFGNLKKIQADNIQIEMSNYHREYICKIIEAVKNAFKLQLKEQLNG